MSFASKIRVAVLRGGPSSGYEASLKTGDAVLKHLAPHYEGIDVFIDGNGVWHVGGIEKSPVDALQHADVAFVALHGEFGEDGKIQRILEHVGIPFTGSTAFASALAANKHLTKSVLSAIVGSGPSEFAVRLPIHKLFTREDIANKGLHEIFREIAHPSVVKPVSARGAAGVSVVRDFFELAPAIDKALAHGDAVMIEEFIEGREATCGVLEGFRGSDLYTFLPMPTSFDEEAKKRIQKAAEAVHRELGLRHYSHSDFIVHPKRGVYFLEVNSLPGIHADSPLSKSIEAIGSNLSEFLDHVLTLAREGK